MVRIVGSDNAASQGPAAEASTFRVAGTFRLSFDGATTTVVPHDCSAQQMANALNSLPTIGEVAVTRGAENSVDGTTTLGGR